MLTLATTPMPTPPSTSVLLGLAALAIVIGWCRHGHTTLESIEGPLAHARALGFKCIVGHLPVDRAHTRAAQAVCKGALDATMHALQRRSTEAEAVGIKLCYFAAAKDSTKDSVTGNEGGEGEGTVDMDRLHAFLDRAADRGVFVWISAMTRGDNAVERAVYSRLLSRYGPHRVGLTIQCYHDTADATVDAILRQNGTVRLVKGFYNDGTLSWAEATRSLERNARKLIAHESALHQLATHDFDLLERLGREGGPATWTKVQVAFFWFARHHVFHRLARFPHRLPYAAFYFPTGQVASAFHLRHVHKPRLVARLVNGWLSRLWGN